MDRREWLEARRGGIGGSDIAAIVGKHPYKTAMDVWLDKTGRGQEREMTEAMDMGIRLEPVVMGMFQERHPDLRRKMIEPYTVYRSTREPWLLCTPDDIIDSGDETPAVLEVKAPGMRQAHRWGDEATDRVPEEHLLQCQWNAMVVGVPWIWLVPLIGGQEYREYHLKQDPELAELLVNEAGEFWLKHVQADVPPPLDASEATSRFLDSRYGSGNGNVAVVTDGSVLGLLDRYAGLRRAIEAADKSKGLMEAQIKEVIGETDGVLWSGGKITWKRPSDSRITDWKAAFEQLAELYRGMAPKADIPLVEVVMEDHTKLRPASRRFLVKLNERKEENEQIGGRTQELLGA